MKTFKEIYSWEVIDNIANKKQVRVLDRKHEKVYNTEEMYAIDLIDAINSKEENRYKFWIVEETEEEDE